MDTIKRNTYEDYMIRATAADGYIRAFAATTKGLTEDARHAHNLSPVATAALGRLLTATAMMAWDMKSESDLLTIQIGCDGPIGGLVTTADNQGRVKGYVKRHCVSLPPTPEGKLDVGGALGQGVLSVIRDTGLKEPYVGQTILISGEIAEDLAYYYAESEQIPTSVALGVLVDKLGTVLQAGGFIIQLMPGCSDEIAEKLENKIRSMKPITTMLEEGMTPEEILQLILGDFGLEINDKHDARWYCNCNKEHVAKVLIAVGKDNLQEMINEGHPIELTCHFCNKAYEFSVDELKVLLEKAI